MPARNTQPVAYLWDEEATPPRRYEACTRSEHALAFFMGGTYSAPDHREPSGQTAMWGVIPHGAPPEVVPVWVSYDRSEGSLPFEVRPQLAGHEGTRHRTLGDAMEAAVGA